MEKIEEEMEKRKGEEKDKRKDEQEEEKQDEIRMKVGERDQRTKRERVVEEEKSARKKGVWGKMMKKSRRR